MDNYGSVDERVDSGVTHDEAGSASADNSGEQPEAANETLTGKIKSKWLNRKVLKPAIWGIIGFLVLLLVVANAYIFIAGISIFQISGKSMEPTLESGSAVVLKQKKYVDNDLIIFFQKPYSWIDTPNDENATLVKRITAIPGDTLSFDGESFKVNGSVVYTLADDNYECSSAPQNYSVTLNKTQLFVMGDNANESIDSRRMFCEGQLDTMFVNRKHIVDYGTIKWRF